MWACLQSLLFLRWVPFSSFLKIAQPLLITGGSDFGRTRQNIEFETENKALGEQVLEQVKQKLSLYTVNTYYTLLFLQAAIKIKEEQVSALNEHLLQVEKMISTGSATEYQLLATEVKISNVEGQKADLIASLNINGHQ